MRQGFIKDKEGNIVLWQWPNMPLVGWAIFALLGRLTRWQPLTWIGTAFLFVWALLEIFRGVNYFRRGLGLIVLLLMLGIFNA